tara:strand:- start:235 stop:423 length:189 start_codon:yes stop_codon:yes gene_type:complete
MKLSDGYIFGYVQAIKEIEVEIDRQLTDKSMAGLDDKGSVWIQYKPIVQHLNAMRGVTANEL